MVLLNKYRLVLGTDLMIKKRFFKVCSVVVAVSALVLITKLYMGRREQGGEDFSAFMSDVNSSKSTVRKTIPKLKPEYTNWLKDDHCPFSDKELDDMRDYTKDFHNSFDNSIIKNNNEKYDEN